MDGIEATKGAGDPNWGRGSTCRIRRIPNLRVLLISEGEGLNSSRHPLIGVASALSPEWDRRRLLWPRFRPN
ncbi:hypothetical protein CRG98_033867 [Punica granatum]|uniref:Uncharacterized protein n=1 Tax=Punica granatum TaxID=22663 RepID=A0A2I0IP01_PUNGR|nr:hypothetical protein CRG98_033867 [Punica granatum]